jgi:hypothetical protein
MPSPCRRNRNVAGWIALAAASFVCHHSVADNRFETTSSRTRTGEPFWSSVNLPAENRPSGSSEVAGSPASFSKVPDRASWPAGVLEKSSRKRENDSSCQQSQTEVQWSQLPIFSNGSSSREPIQYNDWPAIEKPVFSGAKSNSSQMESEKSCWLAPALPAGQSPEVQRRPMTNFWQQPESGPSPADETAATQHDFVGPVVEQVEEPASLPILTVLPIATDDNVAGQGIADAPIPGPPIPGPLGMTAEGQAAALFQPNYVLAPLSVAQPNDRSPSAEDTSQPIEILPIARTMSSDTSVPLNATFRTSKYIGPMAPAELLFSDLNIADPYQSIDGEPSRDVRSSQDEDNIEYTWMAGIFTWASPSFFHRPLYFEQVNLERYGIGPKRAVQPICSSMHFFGSIAVMPYKWLTQHPHERVYSLGHQRPGDPVAYQGRPFLGQSCPGEICKYWENYSGYR